MTIARFRAIVLRRQQLPCRQVSSSTGSSTGGPTTESSAMLITGMDWSNSSPDASPNNRQGSQRRRTEQVNGHQVSQSNMASFEETFLRCKKLSDRNDSHHCLTLALSGKLYLAPLDEKKLQACLLEAIHCHGHTDLYIRK